MQAVGTLGASRVSRAGPAYAVAVLTMFSIGVAAGYIARAETPGSTSSVGASLRPAAVATPSAPAPTQPAERPGGTRT